MFHSFEQTRSFNVELNTSVQKDETSPERKKPRKRVSFYDNVDLDILPYESVKGKQNNVGPADGSRITHSGEISSSAENQTVEKIVVQPIPTASQTLVLSTSTGLSSITEASEDLITKNESTHSLRDRQGSADIDLVVNPEVSSTSDKEYSSQAGGLESEDKSLEHSVKQDQSAENRAKHAMEGICCSKPEKDRVEDYLSYVKLSEAERKRLERDSKGGLLLFDLTKVCRAEWVVEFFITVINN